MRIEKQTAKRRQNRKKAKTKPTIATKATKANTRVRGKSESKSL